MRKRTAKPYGERVKGLMAHKSRVLSQAQAFTDMGLEETTRPLWSCAASYEERIASLLELIGHDAEAALHRVSAAACFEKCHEWSRAANLYRAALAGPLSDAAKADVERKLSACLKHLHDATVESAI
jgi:hypothetical protein